MEVKDRVRHAIQSVDEVGLSRLHRSMYRYFTRRLRPNDSAFLNVGYEEDPPMALPLEASDEPDRYYIQLYHATAAQADISGKDVLEVGCGHGGGASYLARTMHPASYTGLDLNSEGIAYCQKRHKVDNLNFMEGDAQSLPFADESFDAVVNVESSVHYPQFSRFLDEVARVLRPGGHLLYTDFRSPGSVAAWEAALENAPMKMLSNRLINAEVVRAMDLNTQKRLDRIYSLMPAVLRPFSRTSSRWADARGVDAMRNGRVPYRMCCFVKE
ncbi:MULTISPECIES: phthiotriol/phenolphthiotriol dimycocerosates methyltransferase [unclassified Mycobacterium]|uniref:phthiotriol/phenolphthiotriol dimycocerosates methyltransferase n=1 Tax=unclassified Mycobacterium TaxID=2642494 RepID=UPI00073FC855|nr:SAM-dependent methyltransferase [Mycobacterium sp. GA-0227b]KUH92326.1 SAM-dependent methyltransferase [Mycobacterium sp. GA-1999]KUH94597.1 SAM-dependent methyltransferase [Mycobacterium sp. IS-1556]